jgi:tetratricopeptide (TPR) repeat protein
MNNKTAKNFYKKATKYCMNNKYELAVEYFKKALELQDTHLESLKELGKLYEHINDNDNAIKCYEKIISLTPKTDIPTNAIYLNQIGVCLNKMSKYNEAILYFKKALEFKKDLNDVYDNISQCYFNLREYKLCEINSLISLKINPSKKAHRQLGFLNNCLKDYDKSIYYYSNIHNYLEDKATLYDLCFPYLSKRDFSNGFKLYENRLFKNDVNKQTGLKERVEIPYIPNWNGIDNCDNLLIIYEQGIGDNIQYYRFIIQLSQLYPKMKITYFCKDFLVNLFKKYDNIIVVKNIENTLTYNYKAYIMSLPYLLNINTLTINTENYINIDNEKIIYWKNKLNETNPKNKLNVGFCYKGLLNTHIEKNIPLNNFDMLSDLDINLICIHRFKEIENDLKNINFNDKITAFDIDKTGDAFVDTIAILKNIDVLITIDTSIVHLAGVLNVKTLLLLGYITDWRWFTDNEKSWYDSVEIMRVNENKELKYIMPEVRKKILNMIK